MSRQNPRCADKLPRSPKRGGSLTRQRRPAPASTGNASPAAPQRRPEITERIATEVVGVDAEDLEGAVDVQQRRGGNPKRTGGGPGLLGPRPGAMVARTGAVQLAHPVENAQYVFDNARCP